MTTDLRLPWYVRLESPQGDFSWLQRDYSSGINHFRVTEDPELAHKFSSQADANGAIEAFGPIPTKMGAARIVQWQDEP